MACFPDFFSVEVAILLGTATALAWLYLRNKWGYLERINIPHDPPSIFKLGSVSTVFTEAYTLDLKNKAKYGPVWGYYMRTAPTIVVHDLDIIRKIYNEEADNFFDRQRRLALSSHRLFRPGISLVRGEAARRTRKTLDPLFPPDILKKMSQHIGLRADDTVKRLEKLASKDGTVAIVPRDMFGRFAMDIMCSAFGGIDVFYQDEIKTDPRAAKANSPKTLMPSKETPTMLLLLYVFPRIMHWVTEVYRRLSPKTSDQFYFVNISKYLMERGREKLGDDDRFDIINRLLKAEISHTDIQNGAQTGLTPKEIESNAFLLCAATCASPVNQCIYLSYNLAHHPEIQAKVQEEIDDLLQSRGQLDYEGVNSLKLLHMCLMETLRMFIALPRVNRICTKDTTISGVKFPAGVNVNIPCYALSHDPDYWEDPYTFKPERMRDMSKIDPIVFQPFGGGPRKCLGLEYGKFMVKMALCKLLQKYTIVPAPNTEKPPLKVRLMLFTRPVEEINLILVPRERLE